MISLLYVDDEPELLEICRVFLEHGGEMAVDTCTSAREALERLGRKPYDCIISDYQMIGMDGIAFLKEVRRNFGEIPFILFTGRGREEVVIDALNSGADYYLQKGGDPRAQFAELSHKIRQATRRKQSEDELRAAYQQLSAADNELRHQYSLLEEKGRLLAEGERKFRQIVETAYEGIWILDRDFRTTFVNLRLTQILGYSASEMSGTSFEEYILDPDRQLFRDEMQSRSTGSSGRYDIRFLNKDGSVVWCRVSATPVLDTAGDFQGSFAMLTDISELKTAESDLKARCEELDGANRQMMAWNEELGAAHEQLAAAEEELRQQLDEICTSHRIIEVKETMFRRLLESLPIGLWFADNEGTLLLSNPAGQKIWGADPRVGPEQYGIFQAWRIPGRIPIEPDDWALGHAIREGRSTQQELLEIRAFDGIQKYILNWAAPVKDENGELLGAFVINQDISDQVRNQAILQEKQREMDTLLNNLPGMAYRCRNDASWTMEYVSISCQSLTGYSQDELMGNSTLAYGDIIYPDDRPMVWDRIQEHLFDHRAFQIEYRIRDRAGKVKWVWEQGRGVFDENGILLALEGYITDISAFKSSEEALRASEERFSLAMMGANDGIWDWNLTSGEVYYSPRWKSMLGYSDDDIEPTTSSWIRLIHPEDRSRCLRQIQAYYDGAVERYELECRMIHKKGHIVSVLSRGILHRQTPGGKPCRFIGTHVDISDLKKSEQALKNANRQLNLLAGVTRHDSLNKIFTLLGYIALIKQKLPCPELTAQVAKIESIARALRSDIEFTKIYQEFGSQKPQWLELETMLANLKVPPPQVLIPEVSGIWIYADPMIEKVFLNLLDNSIRHGEDVTKITVSSHPTPEGLKIVWTDNGVGIPEPEKECIFNQGFGKNTGIGLYLVREILSLTGITITETGEHGSGSRFELIIPQGSYRFCSESSPGTPP